jgi:hypothetical protein
LFDLGFGLFGHLANNLEFLLFTGKSYWNGGGESDLQLAFANLYLGIKVLVRLLYCIGCLFDQRFGLFGHLANNLEFLLFTGKSYWNGGGKSDLQLAFAILYFRIGRFTLVCLLVCLLEWIPSEKYE